MGEMLSKTSHKKKDPAIDQEFLKNTSWLTWFFIIGCCAALYCLI